MSGLTIDRIRIWGEQAWGTYKNMSPFTHCAKEILRRGGCSRAFDKLHLPFKLAMGGLSGDGSDSSYLARANLAII